ncbi:hypothetical protein MMYC01_208567 [Madurella mycetomatis]|uniref:Uncharacterized protein n=1 Tax=Madurella mycetomatis TaxID=100816 RepID=A0A175VU98_9PEZI|nr:hypothetical protein MMYC01_208567 [Madurella mycetomatis]
MFSGSILSTIEEAESDFLLLFDCCNAYHPPSRPSGSGCNVIEVISAVGFDAVAAEPGTDSFTHHLDEALALAKRSGPIKAVDLHREIISRVFPQERRRLRRGTSFIVDDNGPVEEKSRRRCPLHYWLSGPSKSITLAPLDSPSCTAKSYDAAEVTLVEPPSNTVPTPGDLEMEGIIQVQQAKFPQVLVCFRVTREDFEPAAWVKWLREAPPEARDLIKIEGFWGSFSSLILVGMPVQVWDLLPDSPAVSFVGFITTDNYGKNFQREVDNLLSVTTEMKFEEEMAMGSEGQEPTKAQKEAEALLTSTLLDVPDEALPSKPTPPLKAILGDMPTAKIRKQNVEVPSQQPRSSAPFRRNEDSIGRESTLERRPERIPEPEFSDPILQRLSLQQLGSPGTHHVIPFPRNEDAVDRAIISQLETLLPGTSKYQSAALYGLAGSGDPACSVFWVRADNETTFIEDYKMIARSLGLAGGQDGKKLPMAVRKQIESRPRWLLVLDNADDLTLFGVGRTSYNTSYEGLKELAEGSTSLYDYVPRGATGTVLWTSRDERIVGTLVSPYQGIGVDRMSHDEAMRLFETSRNKKTGSEEVAEAKKLLEELEWLPLAISQAGAYLQRTSNPIGDYLSKLAEGREQWRILKETEFDRHRSNIPNSVLETLEVSMERIRLHDEMAYRIIHIIAYVNDQDIPFEMITAAGLFGDKRGKRNLKKNKDRVAEAITLLKEFSFLTPHRRGWYNGYKTHRLIQEATRYSLKTKKSEDEVYFSDAALQIVSELFPEGARGAWVEHERYIAHAIRIGEWAGICGREIQVSELLTRVSNYFYNYRRWGERELVDRRVYELRRVVLGEEHPDTIESMLDLAATYDAQGRYIEAELIRFEVSALRQAMGGI